MLFDMRRTVVVFDLDDTLYPEASYVESGLLYVCDQINKLYGIDLYPVVNEKLLENPKEDWLEDVCQLAALPSSAKESLLWMYRLHVPDISLSESCMVAIQSIRSAAKAVAILTDGRSITQRLKLNALGLADWPVYISEEYGAAKPAVERFVAIQQDYPAQLYVYVADNVHKDFIGCNPLGWTGIGMRGNPRNIHSQSLHNLPESALPAYWVSSWEELSDLLCK